MKKLYFVVLLSFLATFSFAQQIFLTEDFSGNQMPPEGWTIDNLASNWSVKNSNNAGGTAPEARFKWKSYNGVTRLISPVIDLTGVDALVLSFKHYLDNYSGTGYKIGVATRSGNHDWTTAWVVSPSSNIGPETQIIRITNSDVGSETFQFCFYLQGNLFNMNYWYIDDVKALVVADLNAEMLSLSTPSYVDTAVPVTGTIQNFGNDTITSFDIEWEVNGAVHTTSFADTALGFGDTYDFVCNDLFHYPVGSYDLSVRIKSVNGAPDDYPGDDTLIQKVHVASYSIDKKPCFEEFTSCTCSPCAGFNASFVPWCNNHEDEITLIKYQMSWPTPGDPYYTEEGGYRRQYYGVSWVPWLEADGRFTQTSTAAAQAVLDQAANELGLLKIASTFSLDMQHNITVNTTVLPFANFDDFRIHMMVFEKETTGNTGSNGETSFQHVMMKMIPDTNGTVVNLIDRQPQTISYTLNLSGTNIEEWNDLGVIIICQDFTSRRIFQSDYSEENGSFANEARLSNITINGEPLEGFDPETYEYNVELPEGTTDVPVVEAQLMDENGTKVIVDALSLPGTTTIDAYGEDLATHLAYTVNFTIATGMDDNEADQVILYPNPTTGNVFIAGMDVAGVKVYSLTGALVYENDQVNQGVIDLSNLENGIYFVSIINDQNKMITKKITIMK